MPRKKMGLEQRLNFWVSQETYDYYVGVSEQRGEKISELLRHVLDRAKKLFDEEGNFTSDLPMSTGELENMMRRVAQEETSKMLHGSVAPDDVDPELRRNLENQRAATEEVKQKVKGKKANV